MARRHIHYEAAFEDYLRSRGLPYVAVDETRKAIFAGTRVKSFDFLVYHDRGSNRLVDVKGRKFPCGYSLERCAPTTLPRRHPEMRKKCATHSLRIQPAALDFLVRNFSIASRSWSRLAQK